MCKQPTSSMWPSEVSLQNLTTLKRDVRSYREHEKTLKYMCIATEVFG